MNLDTTQQQLVADHLKHKLSTAKQNYVSKLNPTKASRAHRVLRSLVHQKTETKPSSETHKDQEEQVREEENQEEQDREEENQEEDPKEGHEEVQPKGLTTAEKVVVSSVFGETIQTGKFITLYDVCQKMRTDLYLRKFVVDADKVKKIADFIRYRTNTVRQTVLHDLSDETDEYAIASLTNTTSGSRHVWDEQETQVIEEFFSSIPSLPRKREITQKFNEDLVLKHILRREGRDRCYEKVKNLFKKRTSH